MDLDHIAFLSLPFGLGCLIGAFAWLAGRWAGVSWALGILGLIVTSYFALGNGTLFGGNGKEQAFAAFLLWYVAGPLLVGAVAPALAWEWLSQAWALVRPSPRATPSPRE